MIELFEKHEQHTRHNSSKGNQLKWKDGNIWYKADYMGYEGLSEYIISHLLNKSTLKKEEFVLYEPVKIKYKRQIYRGVECPDFLTDDWQIITLERLFQTKFGASLHEAIWHIPDREERFLFLVRQIERITGLSGFDIYLNKIFTIDAFFLNEDRHMHNIAVLMNKDGEFAFCPFFDHGAGLLSDTSLDYPLGEDLEELMNDVEAKSISTNFDEQLDFSEEACGYHLHFSFTIEDVEELLNNDTVYNVEEKNRILEIMRVQMRKYQYLFE